MMYRNFKDLDEFETQKASNILMLVYFSHENCNVCKVLKPKVEEYVKEFFQRLGLFYIDTVKQPELAGQNSVFTVPTIILYTDGKESQRFSRNFGLDELMEKLDRFYTMAFGSG